MIGWSATMTEPGEYVLTGGGAFILGGDSPRLEHARLVLAPRLPGPRHPQPPGRALEQAGDELRHVHAGRDQRLSLGELASRREIRSLALRIIREVVRGRAGAQRAVRARRRDPPRLLVKVPAFLAHLAIWMAARDAPDTRSPG